MTRGTAQLSTFNAQRSTSNEGGMGQGASICRTIIGRFHARSRHTEPPQSTAQIGRFREKIGRLSDDSVMGFLQAVGYVSSSSGPS